MMRIHLRKSSPAVLIGCENLKYKTGFRLRNAKVLLDLSDTVQIVAQSFLGIGITNNIKFLDRC